MGTIRERAPTCNTSRHLRNAPLPRGKKKKWCIKSNLKLHSPFSPLLLLLPAVFSVLIQRYSQTRKYWGGKESAVTNTDSKLFFPSSSHTQIFSIFYTNHESCNSLRLKCPKKLLVLMDVWTGQDPCYMKGGVLGRWSRKSDIHTRLPVLTA